MPSLHELVWIVVAIFVIWLGLKLAKVAIRIILFVIVLVVVLWAVQHFLMR